MLLGICSQGYSIEGTITSERQNMHSSPSQTISHTSNQDQLNITMNETSRSRKCEGKTIEKREKCIKPVKLSRNQHWCLVQSKVAESWVNDHEI